MKRMLITIDGPAGAGKTTVSREVAGRLGYTYVDTGALYRAVALAALSDKGAADDDERLAKLCQGLDLRFRETAEGRRLFLNGEDVSEKIRTQRVTMLASALSAKAIVRDCLLGVQRKMGKEGGAVFEGRDMGTVVFPHADLKFFLDADSAVRAKRRHAELLEKGMDVALTEVSETMHKRDRDDATRALAPLRPAPDAVLINSTALDVEAVVAKILERVAAASR